MSSSLITNSDYLINLNSGTNTLSILGTVAINGNLSVSGNATLSGNILGDRIQNGTTSIDIQSVNGNANITVGGTSNIAVFATTGAYVSGLLSATGNVLTAANVTGGNINTVGIMSAGGAISGNNITTGGFIVATQNITGGNLLTGGVVSATGNISGNFYIGNGSQLTGIITSYGNANVVANLAALDSNPVSTTGNVTGGNINTVGIMSAGGTISGNNITTGGFIVATQNITGGNLSATGNIIGNTAGFAIGYLNVPQVAFTGNATIAATDAGKHYYSTLSTANVLTIANNTSVSWAVGTAISLVNRGTGNITVAQGSGVSLYLAGNATAGNRTVTTYGMATLMNVAANIWMINGLAIF